jgi:hypothetical protein
MSAPKSWREEQDEIVLRIDAALARRRRAKMIAKINQITQKKRGEALIALSVLNSFLHHEDS